jgi:hypothetical protein
MISSFMLSILLWKKVSSAMAETVQEQDQEDIGAREEDELREIDLVVNVQSGIA